MAKSANNFYTLRDIEKKYENISKSLLYRAIRLSFMNAKYAESVDFSFIKLEQNINVIAKLDESLAKLDSLIKQNTLKNLPFRRDLRNELQIFIAEYMDALEDDFNMPEAIAVFNSYITFVNANVDGKELSL